MKQGILVNGRTRILFRKQGALYKPRRVGERRRRGVRGCIIGPDICAIHLKIVKKGESEIDGCTNVDKPNMRAPKRKNNIIKMFALEKKDDVKKYVVKREIKRGDKTFYKSPKIQRVVSEKRVRRKKIIRQGRKDRWEATKEAVAKYEKLLSQFAKEKKAAQAAAKAEAAAVAAKK